MKVGPLEPRIPTAAGGGGERPVAAPAAATAQEPSAKVELSSAAALRGSDGSAEFDAEKVQRVAQAIRDGSYRIDPEAIADKLIANAREILERVAR